jgi:anti-anti-sigma factor
MQLSVASFDKDVVSILCEGQITQYDLQTKASTLESLLGVGGFARKVLLSLEKTSYIDSSGIGWLLSCHKNFLQGGGLLVIHSIPPMVLQVLQMLRMQAILHIADNESQARAKALGDKHE